jgi:hypothetical protein
MRIYHAFSHKSPMPFNFNFNFSLGIRVFCESTRTCQTQFDCLVMETIFTNNKFHICLDI